MALLSRKRDVITIFHVLNVQKEILSKEALGEKMGDFGVHILPF